jgi:single-strand DNA-binding protein
MASLNRVMLIGHLGKDPEIRATQDGREIANFSLATSESWKDKATGERKEKSEWHRVVVFNEGLVKVVKSYLRKGSKVYVEGAITTRKWTDNSGVEKYSTEIVLQNFNGTIVLLDGKDAQEATPHSAAKTDGYAPAPTAIDDEIPF